MASTWLLAGQVCAAERALWVWGMAKDIVLNTNNAKADFFSFCDAPQGNATKAISTVFIDAKPYGFNLLTYNSGTDLRNFLNEAHTRARPIKIEFLSGNKLWGTPQHSAEGEAEMLDVLNFNKGTTDANKRFDGIQYDVEPYLLDAKRSSDPLDWAYDKALIWNTYLTLLTNCQAQVAGYNGSYNPDIRFGVAIPRWYEIGTTYGPEPIIDRVDYTAIMDYKDNSSDIISGAIDEITYAASHGKNVYVGVETGHPTDTVEFPPSTTFYEEGNAVMETVLGQVNTDLVGYASYLGIAIHYYEELTQPTGARGFEASYRRLWTTSYLGHTPIVAVVSPNRAGEIWYKGSSAGYIQWETTDLDGDSVTVELQYSADGGTNWTSLASGLSGSGNYPWNTSALAVGTNYLIKAKATDTSASHLVGYDVSNNTFSIFTTVTQTAIADLQAWCEVNTSLRLKWTPPTCTPRYYDIYRGMNGATPSIYQNNLLAVNKYIDTGVTNPNKYQYYIKAKYGDGTTGAASNNSNMLIPGNAFLIDYGNNNEGLTYNIWGPSTLAKSYSVTNSMEGNSSMKLDYTFVSGWGNILIGAFPVKIDISPYNSVMFWAKGGAGTRPTVRLQLRESGGVNGDEAWQSPELTISNTDWAEYQINFSDFTRESVLSGTGNNMLDTHSIGEYALGFYGGSGGPYTYYIDEIRLLQAGGTISVPGDYDFGTISATISDHRFKVGPYLAYFSGFNSPWTLRVWTNNNPAASKADAPNYTGLKGEDTVTYIPLKVWCVNFGPGSVPDPEDDQYWVNNATGYFRIPEYNEMDPPSGDRYTWRRLCWAPGGELNSPVTVYLAIDVLGKKNQQYSTSTLTFEYINE